MKIGRYECCSIEMSTFHLDGGAMFGIVPKTLWEKKIPADDQNRIPMKARALLVKGSNKNILIDTGCGDKFDARLKKIYGISENLTGVSDQLNEKGLGVEDITDVVLTHLHFDHAGGAVKKDGECYEPFFPNAVYHVHKKQWENALSPSIREQGSYFKNDFVPLHEKKVLNLITDNKSPFENIEFIISDGHTRGQLHPVIKGDDEALMYCGDLFPTSSHIREAWHMGYDINPVKIIEEKAEIIQKAISLNWVLFFEHDPYHIAARIRSGAKSVEISEFVKL